MKKLNNLQKRKILEIQYNKFKQYFNLTIQIGIELEFYLLNNIKDIDNLFEEIQVEAKKYNINIPNIKEEKGQDQYEIDLEPADPLIAANQIQIIKNVILKVTKNNCSFEARPFIDRPGNAMHFNISLYDLQNQNIFYKENERINEYLSYAIGGLLKFLNESMIFFAPTIDSYKRFIDNFETPTKICWGGNNRTTALRVISNLDKNVRIEHRIPGSDCDVDLSIAAIIASIYYGLEHKIAAPSPIYGNAFDSQYNHIPISNSLKQSIEYFNKGELIKIFKA